MESPHPLTVRAKTSTPAIRIVRDRLQAQAVAQLWYLFGVVLALLALVRIFDVLSRLMFKAKPAASFASEKELPEQAVTPGQTGKLSWRRFPAALAAGFRIVAFRVVVPIGVRSVASVTEATFIGGFILANLLLLLLNADNLNSIFYQDRAALLASSQIPLVTALAGKNNLVSFVTGISHEKLNVLHRASARTMLLLLWMHAMSRTYNVLPKNFNLTHGWMQCGVAGLITFSLAMLLSLRIVRKQAFEFFLISHIVLILVFLICGFFHMRFTGYEVFVWPGLVIWGLDRLLRLGRIMFNNRVWSRKRDVRATVELLSEDTVRVALPRKLSWRAGQHAYLILPSVSGLPTEAHPFTIASICQPMDGSAASNDRDVVFLIRGRSGFTRRLRDHAKGSENGTGTVSAFIDGPYGYPPDHRSYSTLVLIAGGSGVSYTLPLLMDAIRHANLGNTNIQRMVFMWAVRDEAHIRWISKLLGECVTAAPSTLQIEHRIHVTSDNVVDSSSRMGSAEGEEKDRSTEESFPCPSTVVYQGRPDIKAILLKEIQNSPGPVSVDVAGPSSLAQDVRAALRSEMARPSAVLRGMASVSLHMEIFGMVNV